MSHTGDKIESGANNITIDANGAKVNATLDVLGGVRRKITEITAATYTVLITDDIILLDPTIQDQVISMPSILPIVSTDNGRVFTYERFVDGSNNAKLSPQGLSKVDGIASDIIMGLKGDSISYVAYKGNWISTRRNTASASSVDITGTPPAQAVTATAVKVNGFDNDVYSTPGISSAKNATDVISIDHIEDTTDGDAYELKCDLELTYSVANEEIGIEFYVGGVATDIQQIKDVSAGFNTIFGLFGIVRIAAIGDIEVRIVASSNGNATYITGGFSAVRIGK